MAEYELSLKERPGDVPALFTQSAAGGPASALDPLPGGLIAVAQDGSTARIVGAGRVATRSFFRSETGGQYAVRAAVKRVVNSPDPNNDTVRLAIMWFDASKAPCAGAEEFTILSEIDDLVAANGRVVTTGIFGASASYLPTANQVYWRPYVQCFGAGATTDIEVIEVSDITGVVATVTFASSGTGNGGGMVYLPAEYDIITGFEVAGWGLLAYWDMNRRLRSAFYPADVKAALDAHIIRADAGIADPGVIWAVTDDTDTVLVGHGSGGEPYFLNLLDARGEEFVIASRLPLPDVSGGDVWITESAGRRLLAAAGGNAFLAAYPEPTHIAAVQARPLIGGHRSVMIERAPPGRAPMIIPSPRGLDMMFIAYGASATTGSGGLGPAPQDIGAGLYPRKFVNPKYPDSMLMLETIGASDERLNTNRLGSAAYAPVNVNNIIGFRSLVSRQFGTGTAGETFGGGMSYRIGREARLRCGSAVRTVFTSLGVGGASINNLMKPPEFAPYAAGSPYNEMLAVVARAKALSNAAGRSLCVAAVVMVTGHVDEANADHNARQLATMANLDTDLRAVTGQAAAVSFILGAPSFRDPAAGGSPQAALDYLAMHDAGLADLAMPYYAMRAIGSDPAFGGFNADRLHCNTEGQHYMGEYLALAVIDRVFGTSRKAVLRPVSGARTGGFVDITFSGSVQPYVLAGGHLTDPGAAGVELFDAGGGALAISAVAMQGPAVLRCTVPAGIAVSGRTAGRGHTPDWDNDATMPRTLIRGSNTDVSLLDGAALHDRCVTATFTVT